MPSRRHLESLNDGGFGWFSGLALSVAILVVVWAGQEIGEGQKQRAWLTASNDFDQKIRENLNHLKSAVSQIHSSRDATASLRAIHGAYGSLRAAYLIDDEDQTALKVYPAQAPLTRLPVFTATGGLLSYPRLIALVEELLAVNKLQTAYIVDTLNTSTEHADTYLALLWRSPKPSLTSEHWPLGMARLDFDAFLNAVKPASVEWVSSRPFDGAKELIVQIDGEAFPVYLTPPTHYTDNRQFWIVALIFGTLLAYTQFSLQLQKKRGVALEQSLAKMQQIQVRQTRLANLGVVSSRISHELNQPLFSIEALSATLLRHPNMTAQDRQTALTQIRSEATRAARATKAILDFSRNQAKNVAKEPVEVRTIIEALYPLVLNEAQRRGVKISRAIAPTANGRVDRATVEIFVTTTVTNALEAISEVNLDTPEITINVDAPKDDQITIRVSNNGPAIPNQTQQSMFDDFYTTKPQGTGLGLSTARTMARQTGGEISYRSVGPERHPEFQLTLPIKGRDGGSSQ